MPGRILSGGLNRDFRILTEDEFQDRVRTSNFLEYATVHGYHYGTLEKTVEDALKNGRSILMDIDVQGARQIRTRLMSAPDTDLLKNSFIDIFIAPPGIEALRKRLEGRGEDAAEVIEHRLRNAGAEMAAVDEYEHVVVNDDLGKAYAELTSIISRVSEGQ